MKLADRHPEAGWVFWIQNTKLKRRCDGRNEVSAEAFTYNVRDRRIRYLVEADRVSRDELRVGRTLYAIV